MIHLVIEEYGDGGIIRLDEEAQAFLGAGVDGVLIFDDGRVTVQLASGEVGDTFSYSVVRGGAASSRAPIP